MVQLFAFAYSYELFSHTNPFINLALRNSLYLKLPCVHHIFSDFL